MGLFRKSRKKQPEPGPPYLPELALSANQSLPNLSLQYGGALPSLVSSSAKQGPAPAPRTPGQSVQGTPQKAGASASATPAKTASLRRGGDDSPSWRQASQSPMRQFHRPYTPHDSPALIERSFSSPAASSPSPRASASTPDFAALARSPSLASASPATAPLPFADFRVSPSLHSGIGVADGVTGTRAGASVIPMYSIAAGRLPSDAATLSPDAARRAVDVARRNTLKKSKAPAAFNVMLVGAQGTGKTTFIRSLLDTCDLSAASPQLRKAVAHFGAVRAEGSSRVQHAHPAEPRRTRQITVLPGLELPMSGERAEIDALIADNAAAARFYTSAAADDIPLDAGDARGEGESSAGLALEGGRTRSVYSHMSAQSSATTIGGSGGASSRRILLSLTDTPGLDFAARDDFELERAVRRTIHHLEQRLTEAVAEETKVQRQRRVDQHYHLLLYFIDPLSLVEVEVDAGKAKKGKGSRPAGKRTKSSGSLVNGSAAAHGSDLRRSESLHAPAQAHKSEEESDARSSDSGVAANFPKPPERVASALVQNGSASPAGSPTRAPAQMAEPRSSFLGLEDDDEPPASAGGHANGDEQKPSASSAAEDGPTYRLTLSMQEQRIIQRLAARANVVPVLAKADLLTEQKCAEVKAAIRAAFRDMGLPVGPAQSVGAPAEPEQEVEEDEAVEVVATPGSEHPSLNGAAPHRRQSSVESDASESAMNDEPAEPPQEVKRIKLRARRSFSKPFAERPSADSLLAGGASPAPVLEQTPPLFGSRERLARASSLKKPLFVPVEWPFTLILPEPETAVVATETKTIVARTPSGRGLRAIPPVPPIPPELRSHGHTDSISSTISSSHSRTGSLVGMPQSPPMARPDSALSTSPNFGPPPAPSAAAAQQLDLEAAKRRFQRRYRWGVIRILDPAHCDFLGLRASILANDVENLRESTQTIYENYRAEKLEVRSKTMGMSNEQRQALTTSLNLL